MELGFVQVYQSAVLEKLVPEETRGAITRTDNTTIQAGSIMDIKFILCI